MACSSSIIGVSSIYQATPSSLELPKRPTSNSPLSLPFSDKSHFNGLKSSSSNTHSRFRQSAACNGNSFVTSAVVTPNSVLSEEAFKGFGGFDKDSLDVSENEYETEEDEVAGEIAVENKNELVVSKLGLPQKLVESLEGRGITELFPIQVCLLQAFSLCLLLLLRFGGCFL